MGETITDGDFTTLILGSLPKTYRSLINTISLQNCTSTVPLKLKIIMESILEEFDQLQIKESQSKAAENAMMVKSGKGKPKKKKNPLGSSGSSGTATNPDVECWNCGEKGHIRTKCPKKAKRKQPGGKGKEQEAHTTQASDDYALSSNIVGEALSQTLDEGTSS